MEQVSGSWDEWKSQLAQAVQLGEQMNMSPEEMSQRAEQIGDFLSSRVDPKNPQQQVLQELWQVADDQEQQTLAGVLIKMVSDTQIQ